MKWVLALLAVLVALAVSGVFTEMINKRLEGRAAAGRREFCRRLSLGDVAGAVSPFPPSSALSAQITHQGRIAECADQGKPVLAVSLEPGACRQLKQDVHIRWEGGETATVSISYSCIPILDIEYTDIDRVQAVSH